MSCRRVCLPIAVMVALVASLWADDALAAKAKKKKRRRGRPPAAVVVAEPAIVAVLASDRAAPLQAPIEEGLLRDKNVKRVVWATAFVADDTLARQMAAKKADVFVQVERRADAGGADTVVVTAFGADGRPRFTTAFPASDDATSATRVVADVVAVLPGFASRPVITLAPAAAPVIVEAAPPTPPTPTTATTPPTTTTTPPEAPPAPVPAVPEAPRTLWHVVAVSTWFDGGTWSYGLDGDGGLDQSVAAPFFPGGGVRLDLWPVSFVGLDAQARASALNFVINNAGERQFDPGRISTSHVEAGVFLKARYLLELDGVGVGVGGRVGYRTWLGSTVPQTVPGLEPDTRVPVTVVPGFDLHALAVGGEVFVPVDLGGRRLEVDLRAEALPLMAYAESPDAPGEPGTFFGFSGALDVRLELLAGVFVELGGGATGTTLAFDGAGDRARISPATGLPENLAGGSGLNLTASLRAGLGFMY